MGGKKAMEECLDLWIKEEADIWGNLCRRNRESEEEAKTGRWLDCKGIALCGGSKEREVALGGGAAKGKRGPGGDFLESFLKVPEIKYG